MPELSQRPCIPVDLEPVWLAWETLCRTRHDAMDPIRVSEIVAYLDGVLVYDGSLRAEYIELLTLLDVAYRTHHASEEN